MKRLLTLFTGQWADLDFETICQKAQQMGYEGLELACWGKHLDVSRAVADDAYVKYILDTMDKYGLKLEAIGTHLIGQCVGDAPDPRLDGFAPAACGGKPEEIRAWAVEEMKKCPVAAKRLGASICTGFTGEVLVFVPANDGGNG
jgi:sugar phosphate isomerase/epimerase